ncbi:MAG: TetR/AcrR family transcriptional regulator [Deltaproteobacteria bacterium]|nr:TetR/AcrR family transcriptional regulator [Deltaproteobacteria bacterium]
MSLFDEHKAERRTRILATARELVAKHGYDGLTMRELASAARVSVPTLYNLFGGKDQILIAELEAQAARIAARMPPLERSLSFMARGELGFEAGMQAIAEAPEFFRAVLRMALTSPESSVMRRRAEEGFIAIMAGNLAAAKAAGQLAEWAEPDLVARHMFAHHMAVFLSWSVGELDLATFRLAALSGICHLLIGVARGPFAADVEARLRELIRAAKQLPHGHPPEVSHASRD